MTKAKATTDAGYKEKLRLALASRHVEYICETALPCRLLQISRVPGISDVCELCTVHQGVLVTAPWDRCKIQLLSGNIIYNSNMHRMSRAQGCGYCVKPRACKDAGQSARASKNSKNARAARRFKQMLLFMLIVSCMD